MIFLLESYILVIQTAVLCRNCRTLLFIGFSCILSDRYLSVSAFLLSLGPFGPVKTAYLQSCKDLRPNRTNIHLKKIYCKFAKIRAFCCLLWYDRKKGALLQCAVKRNAGRHQHFKKMPARSSTFVFSVCHCVDPPSGGHCRREAVPVPFGQCKGNPEG